MEKYTLFIIGISLSVILFGILLFNVIRFVKKGFYKGEDVRVPNLYFLFALIIFIAGTTVVSSYGTMMVLEASFEFYHHILLIIGSILLGGGMPLLVMSFILYYYRPDLNVKERKLLKILMFVSIPLIVIGLWLYTDSVADFLTYPLWNGLSFTKGFITPLSSGDLGFNVKFYGALIVIGAGISYFICDHEFYKAFKKHGLLDTLLLVAFPMGIVGARLWYCFVLEPGLNVFDIRNGGLAIQGGAILGIGSGVLFMLLFRKYVNIRWAMDVILPTILIAQGVGRWGNFFNVEVHGLASDAANWWFLPKIILNNSQYSSTAPSLVGEGKIYVPLFLIECISNIAGYFIIKYAVGKGLRKVLSLGDVGMCYLIWYGLTRVVMEPLRSGGYEYSQSFITAIVMMGAGALGILAFHIYDLIRKKKGLKPRTLETIFKNEEEETDSL